MTMRQTESVTSRSTHYYNCVALQTTYTYGKKCTSRQSEVVHARLRLGYYYTWRFVETSDESQIKCKVCNQPNGHTLYHYVMECRSLNEYRNVNLVTLEDQAKYLLENSKIKDILKRYKGFAPPR